SYSPRQSYPLHTCLISIVLPPLLLACGHNPNTLSVSDRSGLSDDQVAFLQSREDFHPFTPCPSDLDQLKPHAFLGISDPYPDKLAATNNCRLRNQELGNLSD